MCYDFKIDIGGGGGGDNVRGKENFPSFPPNFTVMEARALEIAKESSIPRLPLLKKYGYQKAW